MNNLARSLKKLHLKSFAAPNDMSDTNKCNLSKVTISSPFILFLIHHFETLAFNLWFFTHWWSVIKMKMKNKQLRVANGLRKMNFENCLKTFWTWIFLPDIDQKPSDRRRHMGGVWFQWKKMINLFGKATRLTGILSSVSGPFHLLSVKASLVNKKIW